MPLHFAAICPHSPLLLPTIGKECEGKIKQTCQALNILETELYATKAQIIFVISPHMGLFDESFTVGTNTEHVASLEQFGDLTTTKSWPGVSHMAARIYHFAKQRIIHVKQRTHEFLDYGTAIPLLRIASKLDAKIIPVGYSNLSRDEHLAFGEIIGEIIHDSKERIAVIASGDLAHDIDKNPKHAEVDQFIRSALKNNNLTALKKISSELLAESGECGYRSILILQGILGNRHAPFSELAYEHPFGVGFLTAQYNV